MKQLRPEKTKRREKEEKIGKHKKKTKRQQKDSLGPRSRPKAVWAEIGLGQKGKGKGTNKASNPPWKESQPGRREKINEAKEKSRVQ